MTRFIQTVKRLVRILSTVGSIALLAVFFLVALLDALGENPEEEFDFIEEDEE